MDQTLPVLPELGHLGALDKAISNVEFYNNLPDRKEAETGPEGALGYAAGKVLVMARTSASVLFKNQRQFPPSPEYPRLVDRDAYITSGALYYYGTEDQVDELIAERDRIAEDLKKALLLINALRDGYNHLEGMVDGFTRSAWKDYPVFYQKAGDMERLRLLRDDLTKRLKDISSAHYGQQQTHAEFMQQLVSDLEIARKQLTATQEELRRRKQEVDFYRGELEAEQLRRAQTNSLVDTKGGQVHDLQSKLEHAYRELDYLAAKNKQLGSDVAAVTFQRDELGGTNRELFAEKTRLADEVGKQASQLRAQEHYATWYLQTRNQLEERTTLLRQTEEQLESLRSDRDHYRSQKDTAELSTRALTEEVSDVQAEAQQLKEKNDELHKKLTKMETDLSLSQISVSAQKTTTDRAWQAKWAAEQEVRELKQSLSKKLSELDRAQSDNRALRSELESKLAMISQYQKEKEKFSVQMQQLGSTQSVLCRKEKELKTAKESVELLEQKLASATAKVSEFEDLKARHEAMTKELKEAGEKHLQFISKLHQSQQEVRTLRTELADVKAQNAQLAAKGDLEKKVEDVTSALNRIKLEKRKHLEALLKLRNELKVEKAQALASGAKADQLSVSLAALEMKERELQSELESQDAMLKRQNKLLESSDQQLVASKQQSEELLATLKEKTDRLDDLEQAARERDELSETVDTLRAELEKEQSENKKLSSKLFVTESNLMAKATDETEFHEERSRLIKEIGELRAEISSLRQVQRQAAELQKELGTARTEFEQKTEELKKVSQSKRKLQGEQDKTQQQLNDSMQLVKQMKTGLIKMESELLVCESERKHAHDQLQDMSEKLRIAEETERGLKRRLAEVEDLLDEQYEANALLRTEIEEMQPQAFESNLVLASMAPVEDREEETTGLHKRIAELEEQLETLQLENDTLKVTMMEPKGPQKDLQPTLQDSLRPVYEDDTEGDTDSLRLGNPGFREQPSDEMTSLSQYDLHSMGGGLISLPHHLTARSAQSKTTRPDFENMLLLKRVRIAEEKKEQFERDLENRVSDLTDIRRELTRTTAERDTLKNKLEAMDSGEDVTSVLQGQLQREKEKVRELELGAVRKGKEAESLIQQAENVRDSEARARMDIALKLKHMEDKERELEMQQRKYVELNRQHKDFLETQHAFVDDLFKGLDDEAQQVVFALVKKHFGALRERLDESELVS